MAFLRAIGSDLSTGISRHGSIYLYNKELSRIGVCAMFQMSQRFEVARSESFGASTKANEPMSPDLSAC
jgi:hypothetical protein